ncbi:potassium channel family protein [Nocardioides mesophilus]|uniref:Two pore domain potassium channel family protein n=1 Tax=Nocardioides mesophilus TaxID=433659 RepID=A0A7G9RB50_9ACTN|nr:potassium channel family protein [Nocardioides mesophilus]QNN52825.1 two pore domain potassium channel family protein [Nocardioides mesophilus]
MDDVLPVLAGVLVVFLVLSDVFLTVLFPASGHGPLREPLSRSTWRAMAVVARRLPPTRRRALLAYSGPVLISATIIVWLTLLVLGWALVLLPGLGGGIVAATGETDTGFATAVYVSGFTLTTLGTGDVVPVADGYRLLTVVEAAIGFSVFTLALTYFLSIYSAITARRTFASTLHQQTFGSGSAALLLIGLADDGGLPGAEQQLASLAGFLTHTFETHSSYPVLRYFHYRHDRYALPRVLLIALETAALVRTSLCPRRYRSLIRSAGLHQLESAAMQLLDELIPEAHPGAVDDEQRRAWEERFHRSRSALARAGLEVVDDEDRGAREYVARRADWDNSLRALAHAGVYDWDRIEASPT